MASLPQRVVYIRTSADQTKPPKTGITRSVTNLACALNQRGEYPKAAKKSSADCIRRQRLRCSLTYTREPVDRLWTSTWITAVKCG